MMSSNFSLSSASKSALVGVAGAAFTFAALNLGKKLLVKKSSDVCPASGLTLYPWSYTDQIHCVGTVVENKENVPLFTPLKLRSVTLKNRLAVSPMCQYSSKDGLMNDYHLVHYGQYALGGMGLIIMEATAVAPEGRISPTDCGLWSDEQIAPLKKVCDFLKAHQCVPGIQIGHAGRKASNFPPFWPSKGCAYSNNNEQNGVVRGWENDVVAPSSIPFDSKDIVPKELTLEQIKVIQQQFVDAARRAAAAGVEFLEIHGAHGYLISEFLSPIANKREDQYGGSFENRCRFLLEIVEAIRNTNSWPAHLPLAVRISCTDWTAESGKADAPQGWTKEESVILAGLLLERDVDMIDCSTGGNLPFGVVNIPYGPGFQLPYAEAIKNEHGEKIAVATVGGFTDPKLCNQALVENKADLILIGRHMAEDPNFPLKAAKALGVSMAPIPQESWFTQWRK